MNAQRIRAIGKSLLKLLHVLVAGTCAVACPLAIVEYSKFDVWPILKAFLSSACFIWFVAAVCLWTWQWFKRMSTVWTTVVKVVNGILAVGVLTACLYQIFWGEQTVYNSSTQTIVAVKKGLEQDSVGVSACLSVIPLFWLLCAVGLLFKKRWARWGNLLIVIAWLSLGLLCVSRIFSLDNGDDFGMGMAVFCWLWPYFFLVGILPASLLFSFLLASRDFASSAPSTPATIPLPEATPS